MDMGRPREAIPVLGQALSQTPQDCRVLCLLSLAYMKVGDKVMALKFANRAVEADPEEEWGYRLRSMHLRETSNNPFRFFLRDKNLEQSVLAAKEAIRLAPLEPVIDNSLGLPS